ncbi:MAG: hypothetical protein NTW87_05875 [Planctomycetota bacterium]|nr:hypothetical protein [Planctomycetota bacterium]
MRGVIALVIVVVLVLGVVMLGRTGVHSNSGNSAPGGIGPVVYPVRTVLECEEPTTLEDKLPDGTLIWLKKQQSEGTVIKYLESPDGWIDKWIDERKAERKELKGKAGALPGKASYEFEAPRDDTYYINLRAKWLDDCGNSVWVKMDDSPYFNMEDQNGLISEKNYKWAWHQMFLDGRPRGFQLTKGKHTLWLCTREDGPKLDQWVISTEASLPVGGPVKKP